MATLKHDAQGFLIGEIVESKRDLQRGQGASLTLWRGIRDDVSAIARAVGAQTKITARSLQSGQGGERVQRVAAVPVGRGASSQRAAASVAGGRATAAVAMPMGRDGRGRFVPGPKPDDLQSDGTPGAVAAAKNSAAAFRNSTSIDRLSASIRAADNVDPTVNAVKEVVDVVKPLGRGLFSMFGRTEQRKKERWYSRFLTALKGKKDGETKTVAGGGGLSLSLGGGGPLGMLGGLLGRGRGKSAAAGGGLLNGGGNLLKRIPILGALLTGGMALASVFGVNDDPTKTPEENRAQRYKGTGGAIGTGAGAVIGGVLGSALGPVGTVFGGYLGSMAGEIIGEKVGEWTKTLVDSDLPGKIGAAWDKTTTFMGAAWDSFVVDSKSAWGSITKTAGEWWDITKNAAGAIATKVGELASSANSWIKDKTGVDVTQTASYARSAAQSYFSDKAGAAVDFAKESAGALVPNTVKRAVVAGAAAASQAKAGYDEGRGRATDAPPPATPWQSGARNAGKAVGTGVTATGNAALMLKEGIAAGLGPKELANFMGQNAHESNNFTTMGEGLNYKSADRIKAVYGKNAVIKGMSNEQIQGLVNNPEALANAVYGNRMGNTGAGDGYKFRGRGFTQLTGKANYAAAGKALGLDLVNNPELAADPANAAKISAWYWKTNVSARGAGEDVTKATKAVNGGYNGFDDRKRKTAEWEAKIASSHTSTVTAGGVSVPNLPRAPTAATAGLPAIPAPNLSQPVPEPPKMDASAMPPERLSSGGGSSGAASVTIKDKTGQNIGDRNIAHIVTGGMGAA